MRSTFIKPAPFVQNARTSYVKTASLIFQRSIRTTCAHDHQNPEISSPDGTLIQLNHLGQIYERRPAANWVHINPVSHDYQAVQLDMASDGTLYQLNHLGQVYGRPLGGSWTYLQQGSFEFWQSKTYDDWLELNIL